MYFSPRFTFFRNKIFLNFQRSYFLFKTHQTLNILNVCVSWKLKKRIFKFFNLTSWQIYIRSISSPCITLDLSDFMTIHEKLDLHDILLQHKCNKLSHFCTTHQQRYTQNWYSIVHWKMGAYPNLTPDNKR